MCYTLRYYRSEFGDKESAERFMQQGKAGAAREWDDEETVVGCEGVGPLMLDALFSIEEGGEKLVARGRRFTVVMLVEKTKTLKDYKVPNREAIRRYLLDKKRAEALDAWVDTVVEGAKVKMVGGKD